MEREREREREITMNGSEDYLCHYGVLGMKWGVHNASRAAAKSSKARNKALTYKDTDSKKYNKYMNKSNKYAAKSQRITAKHKARAGAAYDYTNKESALKSVGKSLIFGTYGALKYNELRGGDNGRIISTGGAALMGLANNFTGGLLSIVEPRVSGSSRKNGKQGFGDAVNSVMKQNKENYYHMNNVLAGADKWLNK